MTKAQDYRGSIVTDKLAPRLGTDILGAGASGSKSEISRQIVDTVRRGRDETAAMNKMNSYGDALFSNKLGTAGFTDDVEMRGNFVRGDANVLPVQLEADRNAGKKLNSIADLFKTGAMIASMGAGMGGAGAPGVGATGAVARSPVWTPNMAVA